MACNSGKAPTGFGAGVIFQKTVLPPSRASRVLPQSAAAHLGEQGYSWGWKRSNSGRVWAVFIHPIRSATWMWAFAGMAAGSS